MIGYKMFLIEYLMRNREISEISFSIRKVERNGFLSQKKNNEENICTIK